MNELADIAGNFILGLKALTICVIVFIAYLIYRAMQRKKARE